MLDCLQKNRSAVIQLKFYLDLDHSIAYATTQLLKSINGYKLCLKVT